MASINRKGAVSLVGLENLNSRGISGGNISDLNKAIEDITFLVRKLEKTRRKKIKNIFVTMRSSGINLDISRAMVPLSRSPREITRKDVTKCVDMTSLVNLPLDRAIIQKIVRGFYVDGGALNVNDPVGLYGVKLEAETFITTANQTAVRNITKCIDHAGFLLSGIYLSSMASASSVLDNSQKVQGVLLLDIGDSLTEAIVFKDCKLRDFIVIKKGVSNILDEKKHPDKKKIDTLLDDIVSKLKDEREYFSSVMVTGGGALLDGMIEEIEKVFKLPAKIGIVKSAGRHLNPQDAIVHTSTIGLIEQVAREFRSSRVHNNPIRKIFRKIIDIYETYF